MQNASRSTFQGAAWNMTDEDGSISVLDDAFARSKLPTRSPAPFQDEPLGADSWDMWVNHTLVRAGITVERVG